VARGGVPNLTFKLPCACRLQPVGDCRGHVGIAYAVGKGYVLKRCEIMITAVDGGCRPILRLHLGCQVNTLAKMLLPHWIIQSLAVANFHLLPVGIDRAHYQGRRRPSYRL
jgi:hypothetical protein